MEENNTETINTLVKSKLYLSIFILENKSKLMIFKINNIAKINITPIDAPLISAGLKEIWEQILNIKNKNK